MVGGLFVPLLVWNSRAANSCIRPDRGLSPRIVCLSSRYRYVFVRTRLLERIRTWLTRDGVVDGDLKRRPEMDGFYGTVLSMRMKRVNMLGELFVSLASFLVVDSMIAAVVENRR